MKICFLLPCHGIFGGLFTVCEHAKRLAQKGHDVLVAFEQGTSPIRVTSYPGMDAVPTKLLAEIGEAEEFDVAFATWWETAYSITRVRAKHYCYFVQGFEERFYDPLESRLPYFVRKSYEENFHLFTITEALRDYLREQFGRESTVIRNAVNVEWFQDVAPRIPRQRPERMRVLVEGASRVPFKRIALAFSVLEEVPEVETVYLNAQGGRAPHWKVDHEFTKVPYGEVPGIYASCDVLLKLSSEESFALPVLEMFAAGGTAVVSAFQGHAEYIRDGVNALVVAIDDRGSAVRALRRLVTDPGLRKRLQANARETCGEFSWDRSSAELDATLQNLPRLPELRIVPALGKELVVAQGAEVRWNSAGDEFRRVVTGRNRVVGFISAVMRAARSAGFLGRRPG